MAKETCELMIKKYQDEGNEKLVEFWKQRLSKKYPNSKLEEKNDGKKPKG